MPSSAASAKTPQQQPNPAPTPEQQTPGSSPSPTDIDDSEPQPVVTIDPCAPITNTPRGQAVEVTTQYEYAQVHGMSINSWYHIAAVYDGTSMNVYKNGTALYGSISFSGNISSNSYNVNIGQVPVYLYRWNGYIDDVRICNRALSASEIFEHAVPPDSLIPCILKA